MTDVDNGAGALLARVAANRLWQHHFGRGIVPSANDFGRAGSPPSHPELLDWLAAEFIRSGWSMKAMHKLIMSSQTYMQSAAADKAAEKADPDNELFARWIPRRLEGEVIRDSILNVSGLLDPKMYGAGTKDERSKRRSIYFTMKRSQLIGSMVVFDQPEPLVSQGTRPTTTVAPQALLLMNAPQVRECAEAFAKRIGPGGVEQAFKVALSRSPTRDEIENANAFLKSQTESYSRDGKSQPAMLALADFCQVIFGLNEFVYEN
jgi:hypothetical protein